MIDFLLSKMKTFSVFQRSHKLPKLQVFKASVDLPKQSLVLLKFSLKIESIFHFFVWYRSKGKFDGHVVNVVSRPNTQYPGTPGTPGPFVSSGPQVYSLLSNPQNILKLETFIIYSFHQHREKLILSIHGSVIF